MTPTRGEMRSEAPKKMCKNAENALKNALSAVKLDFGLLCFLVLPVKKKNCANFRIMVKLHHFWVQKHISDHFETLDAIF